MNFEIGDLFYVPNGNVSVLNNLPTNIEKDFSKDIDINEDMRELFNIYDELNRDKSHFSSRDDICTPMSCVKKMIDYIPKEFWERSNIKVLDPCCGNGNFGAYCFLKTNKKNVFFSDINSDRLNNCKRLLHPINIENKNVFCYFKQEWDLIVTNPPYSGGGNKNKSISNEIIEHCIDILNDEGYLCFVTPNNWMTYNNNNTTLSKLLKNGSFIVIDNTVKEYFKGVGSSFTVFVWQKTKRNLCTTVYNGYLKKDIKEVFIPKDVKFIPLYISQCVFSIMAKTIQEKNNNFHYRCDLHNFTKKLLLNDEPNDIFKYETIHTPRKTRFAKIKQDIYNKWNIIIPLSTYYKPYIKHNVNVTQSVGYFSFNSSKEAVEYMPILIQDWVKVIVHLTRYGNFNNIMVLKHINFDQSKNFNKEETSFINTMSSLLSY